MSRPVVTTVTLAAAAPTGIATAQTLAGAGPLTLNGSLVSGGVATLANPGRVSITSVGDDSGIDFTVVGTARPQATGQVIALTETIQGGNAAEVDTTQDFDTVTSITASGATAGDVTAGSALLASGPWVPWSEYQTDFQVQMDGFVTAGAPTYTVEYTPDDVFGTWLPPGQTFPRAIAVASMTGKTGTASGALTSPVRATRLTLSAAGTVQLTQTQEGF